LVATVPNIDRLFEHLLAVLAGSLDVGRDIPWKPDTAAIGDEGVAARLVDELALDERGFQEAKCIAKELLELPSSRRAVRAVGAALLERGALTGAEVAALIADTGAAL
jgi:hypothetical protein